MTMMTAAPPPRMWLIGLLAAALAGCRDDAARPRSETSLITTTGLDVKGDNLATADPKTDACCNPASATEPIDFTAADTRKITIPDVAVVDQDGKPVRFYSDLVKGKVVAINFVFTSCKAACPVLGAGFAKLQATLDDRLGREVSMISVSVDPMVDRPERLKEWAARFHARPGWTFVTAAEGARPTSTLSSRLFRFTRPKKRIMLKLCSSSTATPWKAVSAASSLPPTNWRRWWARHSRSTTDGTISRTVPSSTKAVGDFVSTATS